MTVIGQGLLSFVRSTMAWLGLLIVLLDHDCPCHSRTDFPKLIHCMGKGKHCRLRRRNYFQAKCVKGISLIFEVFSMVYHVGKQSPVIVYVAENERCRKITNDHTLTYEKVPERK